jgi:glucose/arabinose dehydrogenase
MRRTLHEISSRRYWWFAALVAAALVALLACSGPDRNRPLSGEPTQIPAPLTTPTLPAEGTPSGAVNTPPAPAPDVTPTAEVPVTSTPVPPPDQTPAATPSPPPVAPAPPATATAQAEPTPQPPLPVFDPQRVVIDIERVGGGFSEPLYVTHAGDGTGRIFIAEKTGAIRLLDGSMVLDLTDRVTKPGVFGRDHELGFLGMAFHPNFEQTGWLFVHYNDLNGNTVISRFTIGADGTGDRNSEMIMLQLEQPDVNFNGGMMVFGPDAYLYIGLGTGGEPDHLQHLAQDPGSLLGKILRIDVDHGEPYTIPPDNPLVGQPGARPEVYILGVRNPYRFAFDSATGDLYIGGPGRFQREWVEFVPAGQQNGAVLRWPDMEGSVCSDHVDTCDPNAYPPPIVEYQTYSDGTCVILGGEVYRGERYPLLQGAYLFGDFCNAPLRVAWQAEDGVWRWQEVLRIPGGYIGSFGTDEAGEVYVTDIVNGVIYRIVARER